jgi:hypothetical protein
VLTLSPKGIFPTRIDKFTDPRLNTTRRGVRQVMGSFDLPSGRGEEKFTNEDRDSVGLTTCSRMLRSSNNWLIRYAG